MRAKLRARRVVRPGVSAGTGNFLDARTDVSVRDGQAVAVPVLRVNGVASSGCHFGLRRVAS